jgi:hypothetical protein
MIYCWRIITLYSSLVIAVLSNIRVVEPSILKPHGERTSNLWHLSRLNDQHLEQYLTLYVN